MARWKSQLVSRREVARGTMEFTLERPKGLELRAGQFFDIVLPAASEVAKSDHVHGFSCVNAAFENKLVAATRMRNSPFKNALSATPDGTPVEVIAPFGDFFLHKNTAQPAVFVIGGIGITPVLSMIKQATHDKTGHQLTLIYANRCAEESAYLPELEQLAQANNHFKLVTLYTRDSGHVSAATLQQHIPDLAAPRYYLAGPEGMVKAMRRLLIEVGADEDNIRAEEFEGY